MPGTTSSGTSSSRGKLTRKGSDPKDIGMHKFAHEVSIGITKGEIYSLLDVLERYVGLLPKLMLAVTSSTGHDLFVVPAKVVVQTLNGTNDELEDVVSEQGLHTCLLGQTDEDADDTTRRLSLSFGQDTVHAISKGKTLTPKHVGFGMSIHQAMRSMTLVNLFYNAGHSISYSQVQCVDTTLTKRTLDKFI